MVLVRERVALAPLEQVAVDREGRDEGDREGDHHPDPEDHVDQPGLHGPGDECHDQVVDQLHRRDREGVGREHDTERGTESHPRLEQRQGREGVAEDERQRDRQDDRPPGAEADRGADHQAGDLTDRAPGEAVQRGTGRHRVHPAAVRGVAGVVAVTLVTLVHRVLMRGVVASGVHVLVMRRHVAPLLDRSW